MKILFINYGGIGDEILFLPAVISVKKEFPKAKITLVLEPRGRCITELTDIIDETISVNIKSGNKYIELLKLLLKIWFGKFDTVISSGANKLVSVFLFLTFIKKRYGYNTGKLSKILLTKAIALNKNQYAAKMYHDLVRDITGYDTELPQFDIAEREAEPNTVLVHPGVSLMSVKHNMIKTVSAQTWAEVVEKLADNGKKVILAGGSDDADTIETIRKQVSKEKYTDMYGKTRNLRELAELISKSEKFLCSDSAPLHIAAALNVKTYVIFGSTDDKKLVPNNGRIIPVKAACTCPLQPCLWGKRKTSCETLDCLKIPADYIVSAVLSDGTENW